MARIGDLQEDRKGRRSGKHGSNRGPRLRSVRPDIGRPSEIEVAPMLWTIVLILVVLWALGLITAVGGAFIHVLLIIAVVVLVAQLLTGRRAA